MKLEIPKPKCYLKVTAFDYELCSHCECYADCDWNCFYAHEDEALFYYG